ncbi:PsaF/MyfF family fimbrial adhesin regulatory protein [Salmonella enterica]|uniref:PsaF/MyfF family fimbrial adhesin regulatory protein n=1 Tax=Salmonella enterica TaxID=28901 RepID=UPI001118C121|nr:PsaF/MyfF family fimbrial adhesin regulatory protein [Salmonella enterica]ECC7841584.1 protein psaF [Salmonella enterica]
MTRKVRFFILMLINATALLINSYSNISYHSSIRYGTTSEHFDVKIKGIFFSLQHYILSNDNRIMLSESLNGAVLKLLDHDYYFFPFSTYISSDSTNNNHLGSITYSGHPLSVCIYEIKKKDVNYITFFNDDRGYIDVEGNIIHLSSLLLGKQGKHTHPQIITNAH